jgi:hypothetical protein
MTQLASDAPAAIPPEPAEGTAEVETGPATPRPSRWRRALHSPDVRAAAIYLLTALVVTERVWYYLDRYIMAGNPQDQTFFEWALANAARVVVGGHNPFVTDMLNVPNGVSMMANTSAYGLAIPLIPVTLLFGPHVSFAVMITLSLAATAYAWYWFFGKHLVTSKLAAFVGGAFCGFAPGMISQANAHPNISSQFVLPLILSRVLRMRQPGQVVRNGIVLGLLVVYQSFLNEELLFLLALATALFLGVWALHRREEARKSFRYLAGGLGVGAAVALALLAYPLYVQFFGRQSYHGLWSGARYFGSDLLSFTQFSGMSLAGDPAAAIQFAQNSAEENGFFGWPLAVLCVLLTAIMWRRVVVRAFAVLAVVFGVLSIGPILQLHRHPHKNVFTPYKLLYQLPIFDSVITTRLTLVLIPVIGALLALFVVHVLAVSGTAEHVRRFRLVAVAVLVAALLPLAPTRLAVAFRTPTPDFITAGTWRQYVTPGHTLVPVPLPTYSDGATDGMQWASTQRIGFALPAGYFLGPDPTPKRTGMFGAPQRPSTRILATVLHTGNIPAVSDNDRRQMVADLRYWHAAVVVLSPHRRNADALEQTTSDLLGFQPMMIGGAWVWDVRPVVGLS